MLPRVVETGHRRYSSADARASLEPAGAGRCGLFDVDGDLLGLRFLAARQPDREFAVFVRCGDLTRIDRGRQRERAAEIAEPALHALELLALGRLLLLALAGQRQNVVLDRHADVFLLYVRQLGLDDDLVRVGLVDVDCRNPGLVAALGL